MKPLKLPRPCPICGDAVYLTDVTEWATAGGEIVSADMECASEPDIDSPEWPSWHRGHYAMPYVDWLPYEVAALRWLNRHYSYDGETLVRKEAAP